MTGHVMVTKGGGCGGKEGKGGKSSEEEQTNVQEHLGGYSKKRALVASLQNDDVWLRIEGKIGKKMS
jgi:hypothetical protein